MLHISMFDDLGDACQQVMYAIGPVRYPVRKRCNSSFKHNMLIEAHCMADWCQIVQ